MAYPERFVWMWLIPALIGFWIWAFRRRHQALERVADAALLPHLTGAVDGGRRRLKAALLTLGVVCLVVALVGPQWGFEWEEVKRRGVDLMIAVDVSKSMLAEDVKPNRLARATKFGADETIDIGQLQPMERIAKVRSLTGNRGADIVVEVVGVPDVVPEGLQMLRDGGTLLEIGNISFGRTVAIDPSQLVWGSKRIQGVIMYDPWVIPEALDFLVRTKHKYPHEDVVSHKFALADINSAFENSEWAREGSTTKVNRAVITM